MKLYMHPLSPPARKVLMLARHLDLPMEMEVVDLMKGAQNAPEYRAVNPAGRVPTLVDGDMVLTESDAILMYLAAKAGSPLWPSDLAAQAQVLRWTNWSLAHLTPHCGAMTFQRVFKRMMGGQPDDAIVSEAERNFANSAAVLDGQLAKHPYVCGGAPTLADISVGCALTYAEPGQFPLEGRTHIKAWLQRLAQLKGWAETAPNLPMAA